MSQQNIKEDSENTAVKYDEGSYPYADRYPKKAYEKEKVELQIELLKLQRWIKDTKKRLVIIFEGRDAAGKGSTIKRFMEHLNPRSAHVIALDKPTEKEQGQWYFQRYVAHLPTQGEIVLFDRSWYNRAGVEPVMGFCSIAQHQEFLYQAPIFEKSLIRSGIFLIKLWFSITQDEQLRRFAARRNNPLKHWKLSPIDNACVDKWHDYTQARNNMFAHTDSPLSPWTVIRSNCKKRARLNAMRHVLNQFTYQDKDSTKIGAIDPLILSRAGTLKQ